MDDERQHTPWWVWAGIIIIGGYLLLAAAHDVAVAVLT